MSKLVTYIKNSDAITIPIIYTYYTHLKHTNPQTYIIACFWLQIYIT